MHHPPALRLLPLAAPSLLLHLHLAVATTDATGGCATCAPGTCGSLTISYPFSLAGEQPMHCGYPSFELTCAGGRAYLNRTLREHMLRVHEIFYSNASLVMAVEATFAGNSSCRFPDFNVSSSLALVPANSSDTNESLVFVYDCAPLPRHIDFRWNMSCGSRQMGAFIDDDHGRRGASNTTEALGNCTFLRVPVRPDRAKQKNWTELIGDGFLVKWETLGDCHACNLDGGECRFNEGSFLCFCPEGSPCPNSNSTTPRNSSNPSAPRDTFGIKVGAGIAAAVLCVAILSISCILVYYRRKRKRSASLDGFIREATPLASLRKEYSSLTGSPRMHIFTYEELEEATNGFNHARELGVGGFGTVYKGTLRDGSVVAVKRLYKNSYKGKEQFQNEVDILSRLRHPNLVTLYGCTSPGCCGELDLLLVYEFVPNGTLADHLHGAATGQPPLSWGTRLGIAVETASALHYLHAVEPPVVHRDVKTNNILLDEGFHVKVADFGLSRLFPADATYVSTAPQGTPGYVDPMYHQCYQLTDKSDVYSFGVVLAELISSKPAVDMNRAGCDVNLGNMAVSMIQSYAIDQLVDARLGYRSDCETKRTVDLVAEVAFRCLQPEQDVRPPISEVLDVLKEAQRMQKVKAGYVVKDDVGLLKKSRDGSPDTVMYQWMSPSTTTTSNHSS